MNKLTKVVISLASLLGLCQVAWFITLIYPLQQSNKQFMHLSWLPEQWVGNFGLGLGVLSGLIFLYLLLLALFSPPKKRQMIIKTDKGELALSRKAVEKTVTQAIIEKHRVKEVLVHTSFKGRHPKVTADVQAVAVDRNDLDQQARAVKETVQQALQTIFEMPIKAVNVKLSPLSNQAKSDVR
ncbi:alkaline shock response membrane anchor protein AmaP [Latilactobacillus curvatus]|uniref:Alkaline shock response membrane anchor protein AmaP n=1 Tax=Latilactobacillus curvatus TaxID=28038 RepID=A0AAC9Y223_LATCU|nr:alkaline shock response membrane anchor protein AmaP [Latilactobacillus curvatus]ASN60901.1 alkaline shock response membrane anchor protein AmaP [Latilactobacillus curvatus]MDT3393854.1 alkaline shock response membrane anchor protein AmaP [Bacillota bacterium]QAR36276.1 alkaline shock response membrane anchor protein AmaP [Latilactobacillus curvatus]